MNNKEIIRHKQRIDSLFQKAKSMNEDPELLAHWSRYLCVLVSGFVEASIRHIFSEYSNKKSSQNIANFVSNRLRDFINPKMEKILDLIGEFNQESRKKASDAF